MPEAGADGKLRKDSPEQVLADIEAAAGGIPPTPEDTVVSGLPGADSAPPQEMRLNERLTIPELPAPETPRTEEGHTSFETQSDVAREAGGSPVFESVLPPDARGFFLISQKRQRARFGSCTRQPCKTWLTGILPDSRYGGVRNLQKCRRAGINRRRMYLWRNAMKLGEPFQT